MILEDEVCLPEYLSSMHDINGYPKITVAFSMVSSVEAIGYMKAVYSHYSKAENCELKMLIL